MTSRRELIIGGIGLMAAAAASRSFGADAVLEQGKLPAPKIDPMELVNPQFRDALKAMGPDTPPVEWTNAMLPMLRGGPNRALPPVAAGVTKQMIPGRRGAPEITLYVIGAKPGASKPAVLHIHGGGYIAGSAADSQKDILDLAAKHDCVAITVEYRLAPETPFPGSLEDNYAALLWMYNHASELGIDRKRIAIKGESAGGGHAAALAIAARDRGEVPICLQVLVYPMLDDRTGSTVQVPPYLGHYIWTPPSNRFGWKSLLGKPAGSAQVPAGSVPSRVENLAGLPPAWIGVGSVDLFASEDLEYGRRLMEAGVSTEVHLVPGGYHGFDIFVPQALLSVAFAEGWNAALSRAFVVSK